MIILNLFPHIAPVRSFAWVETLVSHTFLAALWAWQDPFDDESYID